MKNEFKKSVSLNIDCIIRIVQLRLWKDFDESLSYEVVRYYLIAGESDVLTAEQMQFISDLRREIDTAESEVCSGSDRYETYSRAALVTDYASYERIFHPNNYDERFGGFGDDRETVFSTHEWRANRERWELQFEKIDAIPKDERKSGIKDWRHKRRSVRPQTPAVRAFSGCRLWGQKQEEKQLLQPQYAEIALLQAVYRGQTRKWRSS